MSPSRRARAAAIIEAVEALGDRITEVEQRITKRIRRQADITRDHVRRSAYWEFKQVEALLNLHALFDVRDVLPPSREYTASPDLLLAYVDQILQRRPRVVVECGSGLSSVWAGYAAHACGGGTRVVALEDSAEYLAISRNLIRAHGLEAHVDIRHAPLVPVDVEGAAQPWYDPETVRDLDQIGVLLVDGPLGRTAPLSRLPAIPVLREKLAPGAAVLLDDADRPEEAEIVERWTRAWPELQARPLRHEKGTVLLTVPASPGSTGA